jgi:hypothetical protein
MLAFALSMLAVSVAAYALVAVSLVRYEVAAVLWLTSSFFVGCVSGLGFLKGE